MNAVTLRNFSLSLRIAAFEKDLFAGFSLVGSSFSQIHSVYTMTDKVLPSFSVYSSIFEMTHYDVDSIV
jgi:hypothetical protein